MRGLLSDLTDQVMKENKDLINASRKGLRSKFDKSFKLGRLAAITSGSGVGAAAGFSSAEEGASTKDKIRRALLGSFIGYGGASKASTQLGKLHSKHIKLPDKAFNSLAEEVSRESTYRLGKEMGVEEGVDIFEQYNRAQSKGLTDPERLKGLIKEELTKSLNSYDNTHGKLLSGVTVTGGGLMGYLAGKGAVYSGKELNELFTSMTAKENKKDKGN